MTIEDTGVGIGDVVPRVGQRFSRLVPHAVTKMVGLGLSIVKGLFTYTTASWRLRADSVKGRE
jgi:signal transduction histidine kinase